MSEIEQVDWGSLMTPALCDLRAWLWVNFGWELIDWDDEDIRF